MSVDGLRSLLPPPDRPSPVDWDWEAYEGRLGTELPADYKAFVETYGAGSINEHLWVYHPSPEKRLDMIEQLEFERRKRRHLVGPGESPNIGPYSLWQYPLWPDPGGVIPWGRTAGAWTFNWVTAERHPSDWSVYVQSHDFYWEQFGLSMTEYLEAALGRTIDSALAAPGTLSMPIRWVPETPT